MIGRLAKSAAVALFPAGAAVRTGALAIAGALAKTENVPSLFVAAKLPLVSATCFA